jgi:hypothetical protein
VVLALAVSDLLQSFHLLLRDRTRVRWSLVAILAACLVFLAILEEFFGLWRMAGLERFTYLDLLALIIPPILLSMAAMAVLPDEVPAGGLDLGSHYMETRRLLYLLLALWVFGVFLKLADLFTAATGQSLSYLQLAAMFPWQTIPLMICFAIMAWSRNMRIQLLGLVVCLVLVNSAMVNRTLAVVRPN